MLIRPGRWASRQCMPDVDLRLQSRRVPRRRVMRQRSLPRPLDTDHIALNTDHHSEKGDGSEEEDIVQPLIAIQGDRHLLPLEPAASAPARMERIGSLRHKDAPRQGDAITVMGLPLSPELAAIALGQY